MRASFSPPPMIRNRQAAAPAKLVDTRRHGWSAMGAGGHDSINVNGGAIGALYISTGQAAPFPSGAGQRWSSSGTIGNPLVRPWRDTLGGPRARSSPDRASDF
jgi:hypothetical protein